MNTTTSTAPYALSLTVTGTSGTITHTGSTTLLVNLAAPSSLSATPNGSGQVALSWPASISATSYHLKRSLVSGGPYVTIACTSGISYTDSAVTSGTPYYYVVSAAYSSNPDAGGESADSGEATATPQASPTFSVSASPTSLSVQQGSNGSVTINTSALNGFNNSVSLSVSGLPANVTPTFTPASIAAPGTGSSTLGFAVGASATPGTYTLTVTGSGGGLNRTTTVTFTITASTTVNFTISANPSSVTASVKGATGVSTISAAVTQGAPTIALSASGLPKNVTVSFSPTSITATSTSQMTVKAVGKATAGIYTFTVTGSASGVSKTTPVTLTIK